MRDWRNLLGSLVALFFCLATVRADAAPAPLVRVGLWSGQQSVVVSCQEAYAVRTELEQPAWASLAAGERAVIAWREGTLTLNGKTLRGRTAQLYSKGRGEAPWEVNRKKYRGTITLQRTAGKDGLTVINALPLEAYLYGILGREISSGWPAEAAKAQAVAARSYALSLITQGDRHRQEGYDVCASVHCQVYGGVEAEAPDMKHAVDATRGLAAYYAGQPIDAYFHSSSGGHTENSENVWGGAVPYLRGVADVDGQAPGSSWEKRLTAPALEALLHQGGRSQGRLKSLDLSSLAKPGGDRTASGRVKTLRFTWAQGDTVLSGTQVRTLLDLPSTLFDVQVVRSVPKELDVSVLTSYGATVEKKMPVSLHEPTERRHWGDAPETHRIAHPQEDTVIFSGRGRGHGVGLSQWGARLLAEKEGYDYQRILRYYYQGISLRKAY